MFGNRYQFSVNFSHSHHILPTGTLPDKEAALTSDVQNMWSQWKGSLWGTYPRILGLYVYAYLDLFWYLMVFERDIWHCLCFVCFYLILMITQCLEHGHSIHRHMRICDKTRKQEREMDMEQEPCLILGDKRGFTILLQITRWLLLSSALGGSSGKYLERRICAHIYSICTGWNTSGLISSCDP